jgi:DNA-binding response OmpR family regulator
MTDIRASEEQDESAPLLLVIEDDEAVVRLLTIKLPRAGFRVLAVRPSEADFSASLIETPALVVLGDQIAARGDDYILIKQLGKSWGEESPPIVVLSSSHELSAIREALARGCDDYIVKPFSPSELIQRLWVVLIRNRLRKIRAQTQADVPGA